VEESSEMLQMMMSKMSVFSVEQEIQFLMMTLQSHHIHFHMKSKGRDWHWIVGFGIELLEEVETLAPSCLLAGVHEFPQHDDVVVQTFTHL
jgi:hypothetical protein